MMKMKGCMKKIPLTVQQEAVLHEILKRYPVISSMYDDCKKGGGTLYLVGGAVRDLVIGLDIKDIDIEVHGISAEQLETMLRAYGRVDIVGKSFGVFKLEHIPIDWALPRTDSAGRKPHVVIDPSLSLHDALQRRDVTMNALALDIEKKIIFDPFNGVEDIYNKCLRSPDIQFFSQDPLRFFRIMQFIGRFEMCPDKELTALCTTMDITGVSRERIETEFEKLLLKSQFPSRGIRWLLEIGRLHELFPELAVLKTIPQNPTWHPEGDVFEHTMQALDAAAHISLSDQKEHLILMYATLCHDLGKATTTREVDGKIISYGHDIAGVPLAKKFLQKITHNSEIIETVQCLVRYHMMPGAFVKQNASGAAYKRLALKLNPVTTLRMLAHLAYADQQGRNGAASTPLSSPNTCIDTFIQQAQKAGVFDGIEKPVLEGHDVLPFVAPGPEVGKLLREAYRIQINENIHDKEELKKRILKK